MMKGRQIVRAILTAMIISAIAFSLIGCGNKEEFKFRDIPFGTKYADVLPKIAEDLKGQYYSGTPLDFDTDTQVLVTYGDVKLYDYTSTMALVFVKRESETKYDSSLCKGIYSIKIDEIVAYKQVAELDACYNFFYTKLTELYGKSEPLENGVKWVKGNTSCELTKKDTQIGIIYSSDSVYEQYDQLHKDDAAKMEQSVNSGL